MFANTRHASSAPNSMHFKALLEHLPHAVMTCDAQSLRIDYANRQSLKLIGQLHALLKLDPERVVGTSLEIFFTRGERRTFPGASADAPRTETVRLGSEWLQFHIQTLQDPRGRQGQIMLCWDVVTEKLRQENETRRLLQMIDNMPINVMTCDPSDFNINYLNQTSRDTLKRVESYLPVRADGMLGVSIDIFHKHPEHQRRMLADPSNLPHTANIRIGPEVLRLNVSAIKDEEGTYLGPMLCWSIVSETIHMAENVSRVVTSMATISEDMNHSAGSMAGLAEQAETLSSSVSAASEELAASIREIANRIGEASRMSITAAEEANKTDQLVESMNDSARQIGTVVEVIENIADKTNLLALNATIEAARAGEAGRGFAVVASEVKELAKQSGQATLRIREQIGSVQEVSRVTAESIRRIASVIKDLSLIATQVASAVEEQSVVTEEVNRNISGVSTASRETGTAAKSVRATAEQLLENFRVLNEEVDQFINDSASRR